MKSKQYKSLGLAVNLSVPETVDEFDANAKSAGSCLNEAINNVVYRGSLAEFRDEFTSAVEDKYKIDRKTKDTGKTKEVDGKQQAILAYDETEAEFIERVVATAGIKLEDLQPLADEVAAKIVFDASARERKAPAPKKLSQEYKTAATNLMASVTDDAKINKTLSQYLEEARCVFARTGVADTDAEALGWLIKDYQKAKLAAGVL